MGCPVKFIKGALIVGVTEDEAPAQEPKADTEKKPVKAK